MKKQQILIVSEAPGENLETVNTLRREPDWTISPVSSAEEAITSFYAKPFDVIVIGKGINITDEQKLRKVLNHCSFESIIVKQQANDPEILKEEIMRSMNEKRINRLQRIHVKDTFDPVNQADKIRVVPFGQYTNQD